MTLPDVAISAVRCGWRRALATIIIGLTVMGLLLTVTVADRAPGYPLGKGAFAVGFEDIPDATQRAWYESVRALDVSQRAPVLVVTRRTLLATETVITNSDMTFPGPLGIRRIPIDSPPAGYELRGRQVSVREFGWPARWLITSRTISFYPPRGTYPHPTQYRVRIEGVAIASTSNALILATIWSLWRINQGLRRHASGRCICCGYMLADGQSTCSECGERAC